MTKFYTNYLWVATLSVVLGQFRTDIPTSTRPDILEDFSTESDDESFFDNLRRQIENVEFLMNERLQCVRVPTIERLCLMSNV